jgi:hypothetical protein
VLDLVSISQITKKDTVFDIAKQAKEAETIMDERSLLKQLTEGTPLSNQEKAIQRKLYQKQLEDYWGSQTKTTNLLPSIPQHRDS